MKFRTLVLCLLFLTPVLTAGSDCVVSFNTQSLKYHNPYCKWAIRCTVNCIQTTKGKAVASGGIPCKVCGGGCR